MTTARILPPEKVIVTQENDEVVCDGGGGALGHPRVYYSLEGQDVVECGYCDRAFVKLRDGAGSSGH